MEEDYRSASKRFWQTVIGASRRGKQYSANTVYSAGWGAVDLDWGHCRTVEEILQDLLNPTDLPSNEEAEAGVSEVDFVHHPSRRGPESVPTTGDHTSQPPRRRSTPGYWRGEIRPIVKFGPGGTMLGFRPGRGTLDQLYTLHRVLEGLWEFAQPVHMCFVDLEKAFDRVPRGIILWGVSSCMGSEGPLLRAVRSLYDRSRSSVRITGSKSDLFPVHVGLRQGLPFVTGPVHNLYGQDF
ncbi:hypothetical protein L3Q82_015103 [Scortum barcoo]|uniref:Uncharacterized protein n=1 Tax=Scortum barcoo TaxID=214431 RepID=A0ACB8VTY1_9TELE|nr:hypothetical protein L3Q82_015103 [Scortum barcoo]